MRTIKLSSLLLGRKKKQGQFQMRSWQQGQHLKTITLSCSTWNQLRNSLYPNVALTPRFIPSLSRRNTLQVTHIPTLALISTSSRVNRKPCYANPGYPGTGGCTAGGGGRRGWDNAQQPRGPAAGLRAVPLGDVTARD